MPFVLFSLPSGVWLDRVRKLPVYVAGESMLGAGRRQRAARLVARLAVDAAGCTSCGFVIGTVYTVAGSAAQIVLTQVVARERLVEAHAKNALATSGAEVAGPGLAGALIKARRRAARAAGRRGAADRLGGDPARHRRSHEPPQRAGAAARRAHFWRDLKAGVRFVARHRLLVALALVVGCWQMCHHAAIVVQILFATRTLGLCEQAVGLSYTGMGVGTIVASVLRQPHQPAHRPGALPGARLRDLRRRLAAARRWRRPTPRASPRSR